MARRDEMHEAPYPASADIYRQIVITLPLGEFQEAQAKLYAFLDRREVGYTKLRPIAELRIVPIQLARGEDVGRVLEELNRSSQGVVAEQNRQVRLTGGGAAAPAVVNDPLYRFQWALSKISAEDAWQRTRNAAPVVVATVDTGVSTSHPDLAGHLWDDGAGNHTWTPVQIREHLIASVDKRRWLPCIAEGRLNLGRAVRGPLAVTAPVAGERWRPGTSRAVTWTQSYVTPRCTTVSIRLSDDGGTSYATVLKSGQPVGSLACAVNVPNRHIAHARIKLESDQGPGLYAESGTFKVST